MRKKVFLLLFMPFLFMGSAYAAQSLQSAPHGGPSPNSASWVQIPALTIDSPAFREGSVIPQQYTCTGRGSSPPFTFSHVPAKAKSLVLIAVDPDAPKHPFTHWVVWNIAPTTREIAENSLPPNSLQGRNDAHTIGYAAPCPPSGSHRYYFRVFALDHLLNLPTGSSRSEVEQKMQGHILAYGFLMGQYEKPQK